MTRAFTLLVVSCFALAACQSAPVPGAVCTLASDCATPLTCRLGRCRNECTASRDCPLGARCLLDPAGLGACSIASDDRCESGGSACPTGLTCLGGRCVNTCTHASQCPTDGECREAAGTGVSFCFAPAREDAGPAMDDTGISPADAGTDATSPQIDAGPGCTSATCAIDLCIGEAFACAVRGDQHVVCWGSNQLAQLGDGIDASTPAMHATGSDAGVGLDYSAVPVEVLRAGSVATPLLATAIACSSATVCAREATSGRVYCWGDGGNGELGSGPSRSARAVELADVLGDVRTIAGGRAFFCATFAGATPPRCWGDDSYGQFGLPSADTTTPIDVPHWAGHTIAVGGSGTCGLDASGSVACAGSNLYGECGPSGAQPIQRGPIGVPVGGTATSVVTGDSFACALVDGVASCWGFNLTASLGRVTPTNCGTLMDEVCPDAQPMPVSTTTTAGDRFDALWVEGFTSRVCGRRRGSRDVLCWGAFSQIGCETGSGACRAPRLIPGLDGATWVVSSTRSVCAILDTGAVVCSGNDYYGQLGRGTIGPDGVLTADYVPVCLAGGC